MATPSRPFWWRFPAPSTLVGAAILFNLPWLEVQCNGPAGNKMVVGTQTGLQTALGSTTDGEGLPPEQQSAKGPLGGSLTVTKTEKQAPPKAPLMIAFGI